MAERGFHPGPDQLSLETGEPIGEREPLTLEERLELATDRLDTEMAVLLATEPQTRGAAEAILNELDHRLSQVRAIERNPRQASLSNVELLEQAMDSYGSSRRDRAKARVRGTDIPARERQAHFDKEEAIGRNLPVSRRRVGNAVVKNWFDRPGNRERVSDYYQDLNGRIMDFPETRAA